MVTAALLADEAGATAEADVCDEDTTDAAAEDD